MRYPTPLFPFGRPAVPSDCVRRRDFADVERVGEVFTEDELRDAHNSLVDRLKGRLVPPALAAALLLASSAFGGAVDVVLRRKGEIANTNMVPVAVVDRGMSADEIRAYVATNSPGTEPSVITGIVTAVTYTRDEIDAALALRRDLTNLVVSSSAEEPANAHWTWTPGEGCPPEFLAFMSSASAPRPEFVSVGTNGFWRGVVVRRPDGRPLYACTVKEGTGSETSVTFRMSVLGEDGETEVGAFLATAERPSASDGTPVPAGRDDSLALSSAVSEKAGRWELETARAELKEDVLGLWDAKVGKVPGAAGDFAVFLEGGGLTNAHLSLRNVVAADDDYPDEMFQDRRVQIGYGAEAVGVGPTSSDPAYTSNNKSIAVGLNARATRQASTAIGSGGLRDDGTTKAAWADGNESVAIGYSAYAGSNSTVAVGTGARSLGVNSTALGQKAGAEGTYGVALGPEASSAMHNSVAVGRGASATNDMTLALGDRPTAGAPFSAAVGYFARALADGSLAVGSNSVASADASGSVVVGGAATSRSSGSVSVGLGSSVGAGSPGSVAVGAGAAVGSHVTNAVQLGRGTNWRSGSLKVGDSYAVLERDMPALVPQHAVPWTVVGGDVVRAVTLGSRSSGASVGLNSLSVGGPNEASGSSSVAVGGANVASASSAVALGYGNVASTNYAVAEGSWSRAGGYASHAMGRRADAKDAYSFVFQGSPGESPLGTYYASHGDGTFNVSPVGGPEGFWIGGETLAGLLAGRVPWANAEHDSVLVGTGLAGARYSLANGESARATGLRSHAEGYRTFADGESAHSEGELSEASGDRSHAEGYDTRAVGDESHAEGYDAHAVGAASHAEGYSTYARGEASHSEGGGTTAGGSHSHAEGYKSVADGDYSHAEGFWARTGDGSVGHARAFAWQGVNTAVYYSSHGDGTFNVNPVGGPAGFWIGETNLEDTIRNYAGGSAVLPEKWAMSALTNANGVGFADLKDVTVGSPGGETWTQSAKADGSWYGVAYGDGRFVAGSYSAAGDGDGLWYSDDGGETWTQSAKADGSWHGVAYGNGRFVAGSYSAAAGLWYSDDGVAWTQSAKADGSWYGVAYGDGRFVAGSYSAAGLWYSDDGGETWTQSRKADRSWYSVAYGNGRFVAGSSGYGLWYSDDGIAWTQSGKADGGWAAMAYGNGRFVAGSFYGSAGLWYSDDGGETWTQSAKADGNCYGVTYGNGRFVAGGTGLWYSDDGVAWTQSTKADGSWYGVAYGDGRFVAGSSDGLWYSDGVETRTVPVVQRVKANGGFLVPDADNVVEVPPPAGYDSVTNAVAGIGGVVTNAMAGYAYSKDETDAALTNAVITATNLSMTATKEYVAEHGTDPEVVSNVVYSVASNVVPSVASEIVAAATNSLRGEMSQELAAATNSLSKGYVPWADGTTNAVTVGSRAAGSQVGPWSVAVGIRATASGSYSVAGGYWSRAVSSFSHAEGGYTTAGTASGTCLYPHAAGFNAFATNTTAYAWNGSPYGNPSTSPDSTEYVPPYGDHGAGTFNVNPVGGAEGFWIGETNLADTVKAYAAGAQLPEKWAMSALTNANGIGFAGLKDVTVGSPGGETKVVPVVQRVKANGGFLVPDADNVVEVPPPAGYAAVSNAAEWASNRVVIVDGELDSHANSSDAHWVLFRGCVKATKDENGVYSAGTFGWRAEGSLVGQGSLASGYYCSAAGAHSQAFGFQCDSPGMAGLAAGANAVAGDDAAFVWNGAYDVTSVSNKYASHGIGTFNVFPYGGAEGFWIGETNLAETIRNYAGGGGADPGVVTNVVTGLVRDGSPEFDAAMSNAVDRVLARPSDAFAAAVAAEVRNVVSNAVIGLEADRSSLNDVINALKSIYER